MLFIGEKLFMTSNKVIIIGGGPLGLSVAHEFLKKNYQITIIETEKELGGYVKAINLNNNIIDMVYHFFYWGDEKNAIDFLNSLGEKIKLRWVDISTKSFINGKFVNFDSVFSIIKLVKFDIFKICINLLKIKIFKIDKDLDNINAREWSKKIFGLNFSKSVWEPLLDSKFGEYSDHVSAYWLATRVKRHLSTKVGRGGKSKFSYLIGTYKPYIDRFEDYVINTNGQILKEEYVKAFYVNKNKLQSIVTSKNVIDCNDAIVVSTISLSDLSQIVKNNEKFDYLNKFQNISVIVIALSINVKLSEDYWTTISDTSIPFTVIIQQNRLYNEYNSEIVYLSKYCSPSDPLLNQSDSIIYNSFMDGLKVMFNNFSIENVLDYKIIRSKSASPIPFVGYNKLLPKKETVLDNFYHLGFEYAFPEDRGVGNSINIGKDFVGKYFNEI